MHLCRVKVDFKSSFYTTVIYITLYLLDFIIYNAIKDAFREKAMF